MSWYDEIKPYFIRSRMSGLFPFSFVNGHLLQSKVDYVYTIIAAIYGMIIIGWPTVYLIRSNQLTIRESFTIVYSTFLGVCLSHASYKCLNNFTEIKAIMDLIRKYDDAVRTSSTPKNITILNWTIIFAYTVQEIYKATIDSNPESQLDTLWLMLFNERSLIWTNIVMQFTAILFSLARRFRKLNHLITSDASMILDEISNDYRPLYFEDVRRLHGYLTVAAENINSLYTMPLLLWIFVLSLVLIWSIYDLLVATDPLKLAVKISMYFGVDLIILVLLLKACNEASTQKNFLTGQYFLLNPLHFSAAWGLLRVDLQLLNNVVGAITTVLVILCGSLN